MVLVKGVDAEIIAMGLSKVGIIYHCLLKNTIRAKEAFNESINITSAMTERGKLYSSPWYVLYLFTGCFHEKTNFLFSLFFFDKSYLYLISG